MRIDAIEAGTVTVLSVSGRLDQDTSAAFQERLLAAVDAAAASQGLVVLDLGGVEYVSSIGLRALMVASKKAKPASVEVVLAALSDFVGEVLEVSGFTYLFKSFDSARVAVEQRRPEALAAYDAAAG